jgi:2-succinyl-6-hydroxy-2,4-cyclohexadiene-1-carboxylate synthase
MISQKSRTFNFIDRGFKDSTVLIPGWAADHRIFDTLKLEFNYLLPLTFSPDTFEEELLKILRENNINKVSLFGWSLGGFLASSFASRHKELVDRLILVSIRKKYKKEGLDEIRAHLHKSKKAFLYKFYSQCFFKKENMQWFRKSLLKDYCENMNLERLLYTLDYLQSAEIQPEAVKAIKNIKIIHGEHDRVAPIEEAHEIKESLPQAEFVAVENAGHIPFLEGPFLKNGLTWQF